MGRTIFFADRSTSRFTPDCILAEPAVFDLRVTDADDSPLHWASNLAQTDDPHAFTGTATWVHLLAATNLVDERLADGTVTLIAPEPLRDAAEAAVSDSYAPALAYFQQVFPDVSHLTLFVTDAGFGSGFDPYATPGSSGDLTVVVNPYNLANLDKNAYTRYQWVGQALLTSLFGLGYNGFTSNQPLSSNVAFFLWIRLS